MVLELPKKYTKGDGMQFHEHLKSLREKKGFTQTQISEALGISKNTYIGYEKGDTQPRVNELKNLSAMYGITISELCLETDSRSIDESLVMQFELVKKFNAKEKSCFNMLVEAMAFRHHAKETERISSQYSKIPHELVYKCNKCKVIDCVPCEHSYEEIIGNDELKKYRDTECPDPSCHNGIMAIEGEIIHDEYNESLWQSKYR